MTTSTRERTFITRPWLARELLAVDLFHKRANVQELYEEAARATSPTTALRAWHGPVRPESRQAAYALIATERNFVGPLQNRLGIFFFRAASDYRARILRSIRLERG